MGYQQNEDIDVIKNPRHYNLDGLGIESIDVIRAVLGKEGFEKYCHGNALKHLIRADKKNGVEDLKKARQYLDWEIKSRKKGERK